MFLRSPSSFLAGGAAPAFRSALTRQHIAFTLACSWSAWACGSATTSLVIGMLSHLRGPSGAVGGGSDPYVDQIREWFDDPACNGPSTGTHPFERVLQPEPEKYCG